MRIINGNKGEKVIIGGHISITVIDNLDGELVLNIESPKELQIQKGEELEKKQKISQKD